MSTPNADAVRLAVERVVKIEKLSRFIAESCQPET
jgi:hypothetical protein